MLNTILKAVFEEIVRLKNQRDNSAEFNQALIELQTALKNMKKFI